MSEESKLELIADHLLYFREVVLAKALKARSLDDKEIENMFDWAKFCDEVSDAQGGDVGCGSSSSKVLSIALLNNPRLSRKSLAKARELRERVLGFPDVDFR